MKILYVSTIFASVTAARTNGTALASQIDLKYSKYSHCGKGLLYIVLLLCNLMSAEAAFYNNFDV